MGVMVVSGGAGALRFFPIEAHVLPDLIGTPVEPRVMCDLAPREVFGTGAIHALPFAVGAPAKCQPTSHRTEPQRCHNPFGTVGAFRAELRRRQSL